MEAIGITANVLAIVELAAKIAAACIKYSHAVKHAKADINRLKDEVGSIAELLQTVEMLLQGPDKTRLSASQKLGDALQDCLLRLVTLSEKLEPSMTQKAMSRFGIRALKWPFETKQVERDISDLERYKQTISLALQVDQTALVLGLHQRIDLMKLPTATSAEFDSHVEEHNARCLPNTRVDLRHTITKWADDDEGKYIFWLNGMAGTGKSTISRTMAQYFDDKGCLGASFFFKRGEGDRGNASRFFATIAVRLASKVPSLSRYIGHAIDAEPGIAEKALNKQFEKLILHPLSMMHEDSQQVSRLVIVIDALDECEREEDVRTILLLLSKHAAKISIYLRIFITSRPELPIRLGFSNMHGGTYQHLVLNEVSQITIEHDILVFFEHQFTIIRANRSLSKDWPQQEDIQALVEMAVPLFIFAATVCRFIGDPSWNPKKQLATILEYRTASQASKLDITYMPILNQLLAEKDEVESEKLASEFREIVGAIVTLANPLSTIALANLLRIPKDDIAYRIGLLHSVLNIPTDQSHPVRLLHLSFRDFLLDPMKRGKSPFWINEKEMHRKIASNCIQLLSSCLKKDICSMQRPGTLRSDIDSQVIHNCLPTEAQYACRYWIFHLVEIKSSICDENEIYGFLQEHFLHWLEAMCLLGNVSESIRSIEALEPILEADESTNLRAFVHDAKRFILYNRSIIEETPLQIYCSALLFAPQNSIIRRQFEKCIPAWIQTKPKVQEDWGSALQVLVGHSREVISVALSLDGKLIVSGSADGNIRLWDAVTGAVLQDLTIHRSYGIERGVNSMAFSPDGNLVVLASSVDMTIRLWDTVTGEVRFTLEGSADNSVAFSPDGKLVVGGTRDTTVWLWDIVMGTSRQLEGHSDEVISVAFRIDGKQIISGSVDKTVRIWDTETGVVQQILKGHTESVMEVGFSLDHKLAMSGSYDETIRLWDAMTGAALQTFNSHGIQSMAFSPDCKLFATGSENGTVQVRDTITGAALQTLESHSGCVFSVALSRDSKLVVSGSEDSTVRLWEVVTAAPQERPEGPSGGVESVAFSSDGGLVVSGSSDGAVRLWDAITGAAKQTLEGHSNTASRRNSNRVSSVSFSPDSKLVVTGSFDDTVCVWDTITGALLQTLNGHFYPVTSVAFSPDGKLIVSGSRKTPTGPADNVLLLWDVATGATIQSFKGHLGGVESVAFSPDGKLVVSASDKIVWIWDIVTGEVQQMLEGHLNNIMSVAFSPNGKLVMSGSWDGTVLIWDAVTGVVQQKIDTPLTIAPSLSFSPDNKLALFATFDWVAEWTENIIRLPPDYRAACVAVLNRRVVLGHDSGKISFLELEEGLKLI